MTWNARPFGFAWCCVFLLTTACGEAATSPGDPTAIAATVFVPSGLDRPSDTGFAALTASIEYTVNCLPGTSPDDTSEALPGEVMAGEGTLEHTGAFEGPEGQTAVWKGFVEFLPGPCTIQLLGRDDDGEVICNTTEPLTIEAGAPPELYFDMPCYSYVNCSATPLPDSALSQKIFCKSLVGVILSAETSAEFEEVQNIRYVMREILEEIGRAPEFFDAYEGSLEFAGPGMADFGKGPAPTNTWDTAIEEVIAPQPYHLELTALDSEGQPLCTVEKRLDIVADAVAQIYVAMPCTDGVASP
jgi:hypothetical protein